jgi:hypothetical protein
LHPPAGPAALDEEVEDETNESPWVLLVSGSVLEKLKVWEVEETIKLKRKKKRYQPIRPRLGYGLARTTRLRQLAVS